VVARGLLEITHCLADELVQQILPVVCQRVAPGREEQEFHLLLNQLGG